MYTHIRDTLTIHIHTHMHTCTHTYIHTHIVGPPSIVWYLQREGGVVHYWPNSQDIDQQACMVWSSAACQCTGTPKQQTEEKAAQVWCRRDCWRAEVYCNIATSERNCLSPLCTVDLKGQLAPGTLIAPRLLRKNMYQNIYQLLCTQLLVLLSVQHHGSGHPQCTSHRILSPPQQ